MVKEELDLIRELNVSDEKKLGIFKEAKFKELEEATKQKQEETKQKQEETNQVRLKEEGLTNRVKVEEETKRIQVQEETKRECYHERTLQVSGISKFIVVIIEFLSSLTTPETNNEQSIKNTETEKIEE